MSDPIKIAIITAIIAPIIIFIIKRIINNYQITIITKNKNKISEHPFFSEIKYMINVLIPKITIDCDIDNYEIKTLYIRKFLIIKVKLFEKYFLELARKIENNEEINPLEYTNIITNILKEHKETAITENIPEIFIDHFYNWHMSKIVTVRELINYISRSTIYTSKIEIFSAVLDVTLMMLHLTIMDANITMKNMNGELNKVINDIKNK